MGKKTHYRRCNHKPQLVCSDMAVHGRQTTCRDQHQKFKRLAFSFPLPYVYTLLSRGAGLVFAKSTARKHATLQQPNRFHISMTMQKYTPFNATLICRMGTVYHTGLEAIAWSIALLCSIVEILWRCAVVLFRYTVKLVLYVTWALFLACIFLLAYMVLLGVSMAFGPGINSQLS